MKSDISILIAFIGGLFSFFSPCVLPLIPSYVLFITGTTLEEYLEIEDKKEIRRLMFLNSLFFIAGFSLVFILFGLAATIVGKILVQSKDLIRLAGGWLIIAMGLYITGIFRPQFMSMEKRIHLKPKPIGYFSSFLIGITFAAAWTPCVGPILASILTLAGTAETVQAGLVLLIAYSLGLGIPFLVTTLIFEVFISYLNRIAKYLGVINLACGLFLIIIGILVLTNYFQSLSSFFAG